MSYLVDIAVVFCIFGLQESVLPIEYLEKQIAPELQSCLEHDDWVSGIHVNDKFVLTGKFEVY